MEIFTDPTALEIIIKNVLDNAVKYSSAVPQVQVDMQQLESGHLGIIVRDQGIGIGRNQLKRIFKRFHRAPDPLVNERSGPGSGCMWHNAWRAILAGASGPSPMVPAWAPPCASACP